MSCLAYAHIASAKTHNPTPTQAERLDLMVQLRLHESDQCLELYSSWRTGAGLGISRCNGNLQQLFRIRGSANGQELRSVASDKCLDGPLNHGIQQYPCHGGPIQQWSLLSSPHVSYLARNNHHGYFLQNAHTGQYISESQVVRGEISTDDAYYALAFDLDVMRMGSAGRSEGVSLAVNSPRPKSLILNSECMDVPNFSHTQSNVQAYPCNGGDNQIWRFQFSQMGEFHLVAEHSGQCLDLPPLRQAATDLQQYRCHYGANQTFRLRYVATDKIEIRASDKRCIGEITQKSPWLQASDCGDIWGRWELMDPHHAANLAYFKNLWNDLYRSGDRY